MTINVSGALDSDTSVPVVIIRKTKGGYVEGIWEEGKEVFIKALCSFQPSNFKELIKELGGERTVDTKAFYVNKRIRSSGEDGQEADHILYKGNRYKVVAVGDWSDFGFNSGLGVLSK